VPKKRDIKRCLFAAEDRWGYAHVNDKKRREDGGPVCKNLKQNDGGEKRVVQKSRSQRGGVRNPRIIGRGEPDQKRGSKGRRDKS